MQVAGTLKNFGLRLGFWFLPKSSSPLDILSSLMKVSMVVGAFDALASLYDMASTVWDMYQVLTALN